MINNNTSNSIMTMRIKGFIALFVFIVVQMHSAYAAACTIAMLSDDIFTNPISSQDSLKLTDDLPPCHQLESKAMPSDSSVEPPLELSKLPNCCDEQCSCIKGGCSSMAFVAMLLNTDFPLELNQKHLQVQGGLVAIHLTSLFRPPISLS